MTDRTTAMPKRGLLPDPDLLRQYEAAAPGAADRILTMAERRQRHQIAMAESDSTRADQILAMESKAAAATAYRRKAGLWLGFAVATACIAAGAWLFALDHNAAGLGLTLTSATGFAAMLARSTQRHSRKAPRT